MLSYHTVHELNCIIDTKLPRRAPFQCKIVNIRGEHLEFHFRDVIEYIWSIYGDPWFMHDMAFAPERHYTGPERTCHIYNDMYNSNWWWTVQVCAIYSDKGCINLVSADCPQVLAARGNNRAPNCILRQNPTYKFP